MIAGYVTQPGTHYYSIVIAIAGDVHKTLTFNLFHRGIINRFVTQLGTHIRPESI